MILILMICLKKFQYMKIQKTKFKLDHTSGTTDPRLYNLMMDLKVDGVSANWNIEKDWKVHIQKETKAFC